MMKTGLTIALPLLALVAAPAAAEKKEVQIARCDASRGTIAIVDGDTQGWTKLGLESPRELIGAMIADSGCFSIHDPASGQPADYLLSAIAGNKEEVAQGVNIARAAVTEGALRSGALGAASGVPVAGAALRLFSGFGGKKKTVAAGLRLISPQTGQTLAAASGEAKKTTLSWGGVGGYGSKNGKMLSAAFVTAYNDLVAATAALQPPAE